MNTFIEQYRAACTTIAKNQARLVGLGGGGGISETQLCEKTLVSISIPASVKRINSYAFYEQKQLIEVLFADDSELEYISNYAFYGCSRLGSLTLPESITLISASAFEDCTNLTAITLPNGITSIPGNMCSNCKLRRITIPAGVTSIGRGAFSYNELKQVTFTEGSNLSRIDAYAFAYNSFSSITIPSTVTYMGPDTFYDCYALTDIYVPWSEGELINAPWGAVFATIHYDYKE